MEYRTRTYDSIHDYAVGRRRSLGEQISKRSIPASPSNALILVEMVNASCESTASSVELCVGHRRAATRAAAWHYARPDTRAPVTTMVVFSPCPTIPTRHGSGIRGPLTWVHSMTEHVSTRT